MDIFELPGRGGPLLLSGDLYAARDIVHLSRGEIKQAVFLLQGMLEINGPLWSLYIEAKLYVLFACALALFTSGRGIAQKLILAVIIFYVAKAGVEFNPGFAGYAAVWLTGALAYYVWNESGGRLNRLLMCGGLIAFIVLVEGWRAQRLGTAPWIVARDVLVAAGIAWLLFKLRVAMPAGKRLADCSYSLYATHFPVLLLAQSLLISTNSTSVTAAVGVAVISTVVSIGVALIGGAIEAKKAAAQSRILALTMHLKKRYST